MDNSKSGLKKIEYCGYVFTVQAYLKNDFVNICNSEIGCFRIDFVKNTITTTAKETSEWKAFALKIVKNEIKESVKNLFQ